MLLHYTLFANTTFFVWGTVWTKVRDKREVERGLNMSLLSVMGKKTRPQPVPEKYIVGHKHLEWFVKCVYVQSFFTEVSVTFS